MKYIVIPVVLMAIIAGCQSQKTVVSANTERRYKPLSEVQSVGMEAQNYNNRHFTTDTIYYQRPSQFKNFSEVKGVDMGAQNYNNKRFTSDTIYFERTVDSLKN